MDPHYDRAMSPGRERAMSTGRERAMSPGRERAMSTGRERAMLPGRAANLLAALVLTVAGAGCSHSVAAPTGLVRIALTEYRMIPQSVRVPEGLLIVYAHNYGRLTHNLVVTRGTRTAGSTQPIRPGQTRQLILTLTPGKYLMASTILSDRDLGIYGTLTVTR
jgi:hypothetical protein